MASTDPLALWTTADVAQRLGLTQERARQLANSDGFPPPDFRHGRTRFWAVATIEAWIAEHRPEKSA